MSKVIDERVVEMRFDNKDFEKNASESLSTVEKLKKSLKFEGVQKGFESISSSAKKIDFSQANKSVQTLTSSFSAMEVVGVTALVRLSNSALTLGKNIASALTIQPVSTGFQEYETQINAIQTILANTQSKGTTLEDVNQALDELNKYADMTIYNFTQMTKNIGTFTAAGVGLEKSVTSIKGIANLAAISGSNAQQASTAMYQLSQALAAGRVSLMDWNSVVNAGMGGEVFQTALKRTATQMGYNVDALIEKYGSFRESLTSGQWLTAEVLTETLTQLSGAYTKADLIAQGYTEKQAQEIVDLADTAVAAATDVKTFTQLWDTLKESAQSGWTQTWEILLGDFEEAKNLFSSIYEYSSNIINAWSERRNNLLEGALGGSSKWEELTSKINEAGVSTEDFEARLIETARQSGIAIDEIIEKEGSLANAFKSGKLSVNLIVDTLKGYANAIMSAESVTDKAVDKLEYYNKVVRDVIRGDFGNGEDRIKALTEAGYDQVAVQTLVNKVWERNGYTWSDCSVSAEELAEVIGTLSDEELKSVGYTEEQITSLKALAVQAEKTGTPIYELIHNLEKPTGRELLLSSLKNILVSIVDSIKAVSTAWEEIFPPMTSEELYNIINSFHTFSTYLVLTEENADKIRRTFKGLFAILDIVSTIVGGAFKAGLTVIGKVLSKMDMNILDLTANFGDFLVGIRNFILDNKLVDAGFELIADGIVYLIDALKRLIEYIRNLEVVQDALNNLKDRLSDFKELAYYAIEGFKNGMKDGIKSIPDLLFEFGKMVLESVKKVLGIHSPSTEMYKVGEFTIEGFLNGLTDSIKSVLKAIKKIGKDVIDTFSDILGNVNWGSLFAIGFSIGFFIMLKKLIDSFSSITSPIAEVGDVLEAFEKKIKAESWKLKADAVKSLAIALGILTASVFILSKIEGGDLLKALGALLAIAVVLGTLSIAIGKFGPKSSLKFAGFAVSIMALANALILISLAIKIMDGLNPDTARDTINNFVLVLVALTVLIGVYTAITRTDFSGTVSRFGGMMLKLAASLLLIALVIKIISGYSEEDLIKGGKVIAAFFGMVAILSLATRFSGANASKLGVMLLGISASMILMTQVIKTISGMSQSDVEYGIKTIWKFVGIVAALSVISMISKGEISKIGFTLLSLSASMLIMSGVIKIMASMEWGSMAKAGVALAAFVAAIVIMVKAIGSISGEVPKVALTLLSMSLSIGILAGIAIMLSAISLSGLAKGIAAVSALTVLVSLLVHSTKGASDVKGNILALSIAIAAMAASIAVLSFIRADRLLSATAALTTVLLSFQTVVKAASKMKGATPAILAITVALGLISSAIYILAQLPIENVLSSALALSVLLISLSVSMRILDKMKGISVGTSVALLALTGAIAGIAAILGVLDHLNVNPSIESAKAISVLLLSLSGVMLILAVVGKIGLGTAVQGALILDAVIAIIGGLVVGIGALVAYFPDLKKFATEGVELLGLIGKGLGSFVGGIAGGFIEQASSGLPALGENLSAFIENLSPFISGITGIGSDSIKSVTALVGMIGLLTASSFVSGIASFFTGKNSIEEFSKQIVPFGEAIAEFGDVIKGRIDEKSMRAATEAGNMLANLNKSLPRKGGILQDFLGSQDLKSFGDDLSAFGQAIVDFSNTVAPGGTSKVSKEGVEAASDAGIMMAELNKSLPRQGGALQDFLGSQNLGDFGDQLKQFGQAIVEFSDTVAPGGTVRINQNGVEAAANAGEMMSSLNESLPRQGGALQDFLGAKDLEVFGEQLVSFGSAMVAFSNEVSGDNEVDSDAIESAKNSAMLLSELNNSLPSSGGVVSDWFDGTKDMSVFGEQLVAFGKYFLQYSKLVAPINPDVVDSTTNVASALIELADSLPENELFKEKLTLNQFGFQLSGFGERLLEYYNSISEIDTRAMSYFTNELNHLISVVLKLSSYEEDYLTTFSDGLKSLSEVNLDNFVESFASSEGSIALAVNSMFEYFQEAISIQSESITTGFETMIDNVVVALSLKNELFMTQGRIYGGAILSGLNSPELLEARTLAITTFVNVLSSAIRLQYMPIYNAGVYMGTQFVIGFSDGITANTFMAVARAAAMARAAAEAAAAELAINSPSKVGYSIGNFFGLGFTNAIRDSGDTAYERSSEMADKARQGLNDAVAKISKILDGDMDVKPTITPVLDLSNVRTGANKLNAMFSRNRALSIGSIGSTKTSSENQNGVSKEVSAPVWNFTQNNYSPKALSRVEIYRQTKNQISAAKGLVTRR